MLQLMLLLLLSCYVCVTPACATDVQDAEMPNLGLTQAQEFNKQLNETFTKALGDMVQNFQRLNVTAMAKQLLQNEPKLTFEGISRLEIPLGNNFDALKKYTDKIPGLNNLNILRP